MNKPLRIVFFGDGLWATGSVRGLLGEGHSILGVVIRSRPSESSLAQVARANSIPVFQPDKVNSNEFVETIKGLGADLALSVSYNQVLRRPLLDTIPLGFINFHAGKLPWYRGRNVINWAIINGEEEIGLTAHFMDEGIDTGDIIMQCSVPINWIDTYGDVLDRVTRVLPAVVLDAVRLVAFGEARRTPQGESLGTYFGGREAGDEWLDWSDTSCNIYNKVRAITRPGPGARTVLGGRRLIVWNAFYDQTWPRYIATPGQVVGRTESGVRVKTGDSTLLVQEVQFADEDPQTPQWPIGTRLGINLISHVKALDERLAALEARFASGCDA
jgi:methionyl-tRNA formyltransferase